MATAFTNPLDVIKVQMQLQSKAAGAAAAPRGLIGTAVAIGKADGAVGFARGLSPALVRAVSYGGLVSAPAGPLDPLRPLSPRPAPPPPGAARAPAN